MYVPLLHTAQRPVSVVWKDARTERGTQIPSWSSPCAVWSATKSWIAVLKYRKWLRPVFPRRSKIMFHFVSRANAHLELMACSTFTHVTDQKCLPNIEITLCIYKNWAQVLYMINWYNHTNTCTPDCILALVVVYLTVLCGVLLRSSVLGCCVKGWSISSISLMCVRSTHT